MANTKITTNVIADNAVGITQLNVSDGSAGQFLKTDGSGSLSFATVTGTTINNNANNRVITGSGTANTLEGEANFVFDGTNVGIGESSPTHHLHVNAGTTNVVAVFESTDAEATIRIKDNTGTAAIKCRNDFRFNKSEATELMRLNSSGQLGIGQTSPANNVHIEIDAGGEGILIKGTGDHSGLLQFNVNRSNSNRVLGQLLGTWNGTDVCDIQLKTADDTTNKDNGQITFSTSSANNLSEKMRLDDVGNLMLGTTTAAALDGVSPGICVGSTSSTTSGITFSNANHEWLIYNASDGKLRFYDSTSNDEVAFIDTSRRFTFGGNFAHSTYGHVAVFGANSVPLGTVVIEDFDVSSGIGNTVLNLFLRDQDPATNAKFIAFRDGGGAVGSIIHNDDGGGVTYNTTSDYRLKENVDYDWDATPLLNQLKPCKFNFKKAPGRTVQGMLAHEVSDIVPYSVTGDKDHIMEIGTIKDSNGNTIYEGVYEHFCKTDEGQTWTKTGTEAYYQELDYSRLVPLLTKALQEQQAVIEDLKTRIETLEG